jgi:hypothetical protein
MKSAEAQLFEISRQLSPSQRRQWMNYGVRLRARKTKKPAAPNESSDDAWERIIANPRPRPKLAAVVGKIRADLKAGKHFPVLRVEDL